MIHAWKGRKYYPAGPVSDYIGVFSTEAEAVAAIGEVEYMQWAVLMEANRDDRLMPLRIWSESNGDPAGWREFNRYD